MMTNTPRYMVSVCGSTAPSKIHDGLESAKQEAERLADQHNNRDRVIHVVEIVATLIPRTSHQWEGEE